MARCGPVAQWIEHLPSKQTVTGSSPVGITIMYSNPLHSHTDPADAAADYLDINRRLWDEKVEFHFASPFYDIPSFLSGKTSLNDIELSLLKDVEGLKILHLQCHFGMDTLSLARMGADVTGVDLSAKAIEKANLLSEMTGNKARFICSDVYALPDVLQDSFDLVFTSYGTIGWLPDLHRWAAVIQHFLKPGGRFVFAEFHPVIWMFSNDFSHIEYAYFNRTPIIESTEGTYADKTAPIRNDSVSWNHDLAEVIQSLLDHGMMITRFQEFDYSPYNCFENTVETAPGRFQIAGKEGILPMVYALEALRKN